MKESSQKFIHDDPELQNTMLFYGNFNEILMKLTTTKFLKNNRL